MRVNYVPIRIAIGRSLLSGDAPNPEAFTDDSRRAIDTQQIFAGGGVDYAALFHALIIQRLGRQLNDVEFLLHLKAYIDYGFQLIRQDSQTFKSTDDWVDYLIELTQLGLSQRAQIAPPVIESVPAYDGLLCLELGNEVDTSKIFSVEYNRRTNSHLAITGKSGSGKTQFIKDLLVQLRRNSEYGVNFILFDYLKGDYASDERFVSLTRANVVRLTQQSMPINPFSRINIAGEMSVRIAAQDFSEMIRSMERNIGASQGQLLYQAILTAFNEVRTESLPFPDFYRVRQELDYLYFNNNRKSDSLTEVIRQLTDLQIFPRANATELFDSLCNHTVVVDLHELTGLRDLTVCLILDAMYRELIAMSDTEVRDGVRAMRTVIVIDEARSLIKDTKRSYVLHRLINNVTGKGASVILLSQSLDDYNVDTFDFAELLEFIVALKSGITTNQFLQNTFSITAQQARSIGSKVRSLAEGEALIISPGKEAGFAATKLKLRQFWRDN